MKSSRYGIFLGYDPGTTHSGIAVIENNKLTKSKATLFQINKDRDPDPVHRILTTYDLMGHCVNWYFYPMYDLMYACIEGASFGDRYRQVELAEARTAAMLWCIRHGYKTTFVPPLSVRKVVFNNGKTKANQVWTNIPPDAANALACAYWSAMIYE